MVVQREIIQITPIEAINRSREIMRKLGWNIILDKPDNFIIQAITWGSMATKGDIFVVLIENNNGQICLYIETITPYAIYNNKNLDNINDFLREFKMWNNPG